jgi:thiamine biosynthesis lipoprotein
VQIDLGGVSKGDTAQQAVALLRATGPCLVDAGGDLVAGAAPLGYPGWPVSISMPRTYGDDDADDLASCWLADGAMATSGVDYRNWLQDGLVMHHLIDPLTGRPAATDGVSVTVVAKEAALAEAWATATLVAGSTEGMAALVDHDLAGLFITQDGRLLVTPRMDEDYINPDFNHR